MSLDEHNRILRSVRAGTIERPPTSVDRDRAVTVARAILNSLPESSDYALLARQFLRLAGVPE